MFLTRGPEILSLVSWELSRFSEWKNSINRNLQVNSWMSFFSSMVLGFGVGVNFNPYLNKFTCLLVIGLDKRLIIFGVTFTMSSRFDWDLGIKNLILDGSIISFLSIRYKDSRLIVFLLVFLRI